MPAPAIVPLALTAPRDPADPIAAIYRQPHGWPLRWLRGKLHCAAQQTWQAWADMRVLIRQGRDKTTRVAREGASRLGLDLDGMIAIVLGKKLNLEQRQAAEIFGDGRNAFSRHDNGKIRPPLATVKLLKLLNNHPELWAEVIAA